MSKRDERALAKGMTYRLTFENGHPEVYVKTLDAIGPAVREIDPIGTVTVLNLADVKRLQDRIRAIAS